MTTSHFQACLQWFDDYVNGTQSDSSSTTQLIQRKQRHTMRVLEHARAIIKHSQAAQEQNELIEIAALLHDTGRFSQLVARDSFDDKSGYNHATEGARQLEESGVLQSLADTDREIVLTAVRHHNKAAIPQGLGAKARLVLEVIRDADKLDAVRNNLKYLNPDAPHGKILKSGLTWHETNVSDEVVDLVMERQLVPFASIQWSNDYILFLCCWIYDLHFPYAFSQLMDSGNYDKLLSLLPDQSPLAETKTQLRDDLKWIVARSRP